MVTAGDHLSHLTSLPALHGDHETDTGWTCWLLAPDQRIACEVGWCGVGVRAVCWVAGEGVRAVVCGRCSTWSKAMQYVSLQVWALS